MDTATTDLVAKCVVFALIVFAGFGWVGYYVARECGRNLIEGFLFGFLLGPIGAVIVALLPRDDA